MAKNSVKQRAYNSIFGHIGGFCAFGALFLTGIVFILGLCNIENTITDLMGIIATYALVVGVSLSGWVYLCGANPPGPDLLWKILYLFFVVLAFFGAISI